jgi:predicted nuclease with TOPRIM domain
LGLLTGFNGIDSSFLDQSFQWRTSAEEVKNLLNAGLQASQEKILSLEHNQGFLEASKERILKSTKGEQILRTMIKELKEKVTLTEEKYAPLST